MSFQLEKIVEAILSGNGAVVKERVKEALAMGEDPVNIVSGALVKAMDNIGTRFEKNEIYVTELILTARAMHDGLSELKPLMSGGISAQGGKVVIGTVAGDLHDIGKNLLSLLLEASSIEVIDLGVDVPSSRFVEEVARHKPQVLCLSALLSNTVEAMRDANDALQEAGLRDQVKVIVGGAALTPELARKVGADAYAPDAISGVQVIKSLIGSAEQSGPSEIVLDTVFPATVLEELQETFSSLFGLHIVVVDSSGQPLSSPGRLFDCSSHCSKATSLKNNGGAKDLHSTIPLWEGLTNAFAYRCHAGLIEISYPLMGDMGKVGAIICGHFLMEDDLYSGEKPEGIPVLNNKELENVCRLLSFVGGRISDLSQALATNRQLEEQRTSFIHFMKRQHQLEEALRDAELKALQYQVNPHFMFNALNTISRLALLQGDPLTERVVGALARLMRYSLYQVKSMVSVGEEVKAVQDFLLIQEARFQGRITSEVDVDDKLMIARMPCMILQTLVENACIHGLEPRKEGGKVVVRGWLKGDQVCFEVADNGVGMSEQVKKDIFQMREKSGSTGQVSGLGLPNVLRRLQYHFGSRSALDIESYPGQGTKLRLSFPYFKNEGGIKKC